MNKYLLIGSAPYIKGWYYAFGRAFLDAGFELVAMNNAWAIDEENVGRWVHGNDFHARGTLKPTWEQQCNWRGIETDNKYPMKPYSYEYGNGSGTTILNALCHLLNVSVGVKSKCLVAIAGADCIYTEDNSYFYGKGGSPDPLRFGEHWLVTELERIHEFYKIEKCKVFNVGGAERSLLPFKAKTPKELAK